MINSQIPYNQLPYINVRLSDKKLDVSEAEVFRQLDYLNGYLDGIREEAVNDFIDLLHLADFRWSLDLEGEPVALHRLMEGYSSENALKDSQIQTALDYMSWFKEVRSFGLEKLAPEYMRHIRKGSDLLRERKEISIKSYFTNLTLYTAPQGLSVLMPLRADLNNCLKDISNQSTLKQLSLIHLHLRAMAPFNDFNGLVARAYTLLSLRLIGLNYDFIPLSWAIAKKREQYQTLVRQSILDGKIELWVAFMFELFETAVRKLIIQLKSMLRLKRKLKDQLTKYTAYDLPVGLVEVIMKQPYIKTAHLVAAIGCHRHTAYTYLNHLVAMGVLIEKVSGREKLFLHKELFDLVND